MKNFFKAKGVSRGGTSGVLISVIVHAVAFLLAGALVVFTVQKKDDAKFEAPRPVERPKMKLKKPKVSVKKTSKPRPTTRIVSQVRRAHMPDIQLPALEGMGTGLSAGSGVGGFEMLPDLGEITLLGTGQTIGNDFEGTFYDLKRDRSGRPLPTAPEAVHPLFYDFFQSGWKKSLLARYYQSPQKIYTTTFMVPPVRANLAPEIFNEETEGWGWCMHFTGELVYPEDIKFRFWGNGLQVMGVRVDGKIVLLSYWQKDSRESLETTYGDLWQSSAADNRKYPMGLFLCHVGDWIELKANEPKKMEVLYGISGGGIFNAMLCVEVEGEKYPRSPYMGGPILPIFKTEPLSRDLQDVIGSNLYPGFGSLTNGPVFCDFAAQSVDRSFLDDDSAKDAVGTQPAPKDEPKRMWTTVDGKNFEAEFVMRSGDQLWMKPPDGQKIKIPLSMLSSNDVRYLEIKDAPEFKIEFSKKSWQKLEMPNQTEVDTTRPISRFDYLFGAKVKQENMRPYSHPLTIEYFAVGEEVDGNNFILLDRRSSSFTPGKENNLSHEFHGDKVDVMSWAMAADRPMHGSKYGGFLVTISNEDGKIIQYKATHDFLMENIENLKKVPTGRHFDKLCIRVAPPRPTVKDVFVDSY